MKNTTKTIIIGSIMAGFSAGILMTQNTPIEDKSSMTLEEYFTYVEIINYEAQKDKIDLGNISEENVYKEINKELRKREVKKGVKLKNKDYNKQEYKNLKKDILDKADKL